MSSPHRLEAMLRRDRHLVIGALVVVIAGSWLYLLTGAGTRMAPHRMAVLVPSLPGMDAAKEDPASPPVGEATSRPAGRSGPPGRAPAPLPWTPGHVLVMFSMWWLMMVAMMLPSAAPMVLLHAAIARQGLAREEDGAAASGSQRLHSTTAVFAAGYLAMWGVFSLAAVAAQWGLERGELLSGRMMSTSRLLGAGLLLAAGLWQLTPLKTMCLRHCRSPMVYLSTHWRRGIGGALRMGIEHGVYCLGCCWVLMALLFYAGVMNLIWIVGLALLVLIEKVMPAGVRVGRVTGWLLTVWGLWLGLSAL